MITAVRNKLPAEVIDPDDCRHAEQNDQGQEQLAANEGRQLRTEMLVT